jgi:fatty-acyl-CoA synthase
MDLLSRLLTFLEDLREIPHYRRVGAAVARAAGDMRTAGFVIRRQAERIPDRPFLRFEDSTVSFGAYNQGVNRYVHLLRRAGVAAGEPIALMMENSPDFLMAQGAIAKTGAIGALINTSLRGASLRHVLTAGRARVVLADDACAPAVAELAGDAERVVFGSGEQCRDLRAALDEMPVTEPDIADIGLGDVFLYVYTSGTTGYPKAAIVRHARFTMGGYSLAAMLDLEEGDCSYAPTPLYHGYSNFVGFAPALHRGTAFASRRKFSASHFLGDVRGAAATHFMYVGELCRYLLNQPPSPYDRAHRLRLATGPGLRPDIWRRFTERFGIERVVETYGQTEANVSLMNRRGRVGSIGRPAPGTHGDLRLVRFDRDLEAPARNAAGRLEECRPGEVGELLSVISKKTRMSFDGYVDRADNEQKLLRDCFEPGDVYLRTGDLMRRDRRGYYYFVDRVGDTFRWKGENVATMEVAELLNDAPGVAETAVYGVAVPGAEGRAGMALVVLRDGAVFDAGAFYRFAAGTLPSYARPLFVRVAAAMDVTGTLKHSKRRLQEEGFLSPAIADAVYFRDDAAATYLPLDESFRGRFERGEMRV